MRPERVTAKVTKNCGCIAYENRNRRFDPQEASYRAKLSNYKSGAKLRNHKWELNWEEGILLLKGNCHYCNSPPNMPYSSMNVRSKKEKEKERMSAEHLRSGFILQSPQSKLLPQRTVATAGPRIVCQGWQKKKVNVLIFFLDF